MQIDQNFANLSDHAFLGTCVVYFVALVASLFFYIKEQGRILRQSQRETADVTAHASVGVSVGAGADAGTGMQDGPTASISEDSQADKDLAALEQSANRWGGITQAMVWLGIILHVIAVIVRGLAVHRVPLGNLYEYILVISAGTMIVAAIVIQRRNARVFWPWVLTPMVVLMFYGGTKLYVAAAPVVPALRSFWLPMHVTIVSAGGSIGLVSGMFSLAYLLRVWQPKGKERGFFGAVARPLPTAKVLDQVAYRLAIFTLPILGIGIILGAIWAEAAWNRYWGWDPKETVSFITWILYAAYLHARATAGWKVGAAWVNILALATMVFNLFFINMVVSGLHSYAGLN